MLWMEPRNPGPEPQWGEPGTTALGKGTDKPDPGSPGAPILEGRQSGLLSVLKVEGRELMLTDKRGGG